MRKFAGNRRQRQFSLHPAAQALFSLQEMKNLREKFYANYLQRNSRIIILLLRIFSEPDKLKWNCITSVSENPPVHILVNNTGGPKAGEAISAGTEEFIQTFSNHLICNQILVQALAEGMKKEKYGRIINIISTSVKQPLKGLEYRILSAEQWQAGQRH